MNILNVVHGVDGSISISLLSITDESEATAATGVTILDDDLQNINVSGIILDTRVGYNDLQPPQRLRTPRTFDEEHSHQCAMRGRCSAC